MSGAQAGEMPEAAPQLPAVETHPRAAKAAGEAVLRAVADLDAASQIAVLKWALVAVQRRTNTRRPGFAGYMQPHAVTQGLHDAKIVLWRAEGLSWEVMGSRLGCSGSCVRKRVRALQGAGA